VISAVPSVFFGVYSAFNTLYVWYAARLIYTLSQVALILVMFEFFEPSLAHVGASYLASSVILLVLVLITAKRQYPRMRLSPKLYDRKLFRAMGNLGAWAIINRVGNLLYIEASLILTNLYLGSEADAGVAIIASLVSMIHTACYSITASLGPLVYACYSDGDIDGLKRLTSVSMKFVSLMMAMPLALIIVFAPQVLHAWVGDEFGYLSAAVAIALAGDIAVCAYTVLQDIPVIYLRVKELSLPTFAFGILNIAATAALLSFTDMGVDGVIAVWFVCTMGFTFWAIPLAAKMVGAPVMLYLKPIAGGYCAMALCIGGLWALSQAIWIPGTWAAIIPLFAILSLVYAFAVLRSSGKGDKEVLLSIMPEGLRRIASKIMG
jgi:membrane protein EpsK